VHGGVLAASDFELPDDKKVVDEDRNLEFPWLQLFSRWQRIIFASVEAGSTLSRPTKGLWTGRPYFDSTLGKPIWVKEVRPAIVWVDASGAVV
jgi:hypothetical protein